MNKNTQNNTSNASVNASATAWIARKGDSILAESDSEKGAWRLLGALGKKQRETLRNSGFEVVEISGKA